MRQDGGDCAEISTNERRDLGRRRKGVKGVGSEGKKPAQVKEEYSNMIMTSNKAVSNCQQ